MVSAHKEIIKIFKAFCDENRLQILEMLRTEERCACKLLDELNITQPTLSHHMKILCEADIVQGRKVGKWVHYTINPVGVEYAKTLFEQQVAICDSDRNRSTVANEISI